MTEDQIKHMVNRFLCWRLPANFSPDNGISYTRPNYLPEMDATPTGTNLFDCTQAEAMVRHMLAEMHDAAPNPAVGREGIEAAIRKFVMYRPHPRDIARDGNLVGIGDATDAILALISPSTDNRETDNGVG